MIVRRNRPAKERSYLAAKVLGVLLIMAIVQIQSPAIINVGVTSQQMMNPAVLAGDDRGEWVQASRARARPRPSTTGVPGSKMKAPEFSSGGGDSAGVERDRAWRSSNLSSQRAPAQAKTSPKADKGNESGACWRVCNKRPNTIVFIHHEKAGLNDRLYLIQMLSNLAGSLCATLLVPGPAQLLNDNHNRPLALHKGESILEAKALSHKLTWDDFKVFLFHQDDAPAASVYNTTRFEHATAQDHGRMKISTNSPSSFAHDFQTAESLSFNPNTSFIWFLDEVNFYHLIEPWDQFLLKRSSESIEKNRLTWRQLPHFGSAKNHEDSCSYQRDVLPDNLVRIVNRVYKETNKEAGLNASSQPVFGMLHLRRGDAKALCDTSVERISKFLSCSLQELEGAKDVSPVVLGLATDETDWAYRDAIGGVVRERFGKDGVLRFVDLDLTIWRVLMSEDEKYRNNFYLFRVITAMRWMKRTAFGLERRRQVWCPKCHVVSLEVLRNGRSW